MKTNKGSIFEGHCWPGTSAYIDFLNEGAHLFWHHLMTPDVFKGTNDLYNFWIDMNEPSVFNAKYMTLPMDSIHLTSEGIKTKHSDVHNLYGMLMH